MITPVDSAVLGRLPKLHVYIDETGDRGFGERAREKSPFFAMSALIVPGESEWMVKATAGGLRALIHGAQPQALLKPIHWVEHFKAKHVERREHGARMLALLSGAQVVHVIAHKDTVNQDSGMCLDQGVFYHYTARLVLERVAYAARNWPGGPRLARVYFGVVKHMDHSDTLRYLDPIRAGTHRRRGVPWQHIGWPPVWLSTQRDGIQLADLHAGLLNTALSGKPDDPGCARNLLLCRHQLRRKAGSGEALGYGVKIIGDPSFVTQRCWWSEWAGPPR